MAETFTPVTLTNDTGQKLNATYFNRLESNMETFDDRIAAVEGIPTGLPGYHLISEFGTVVTSGSSDHLAVFQNAVATAPEGSTIWLPPVPDGENYRLSGTLVINRHVNFAGMWARDKNDTNSDAPYGTIIRPTSTGAQATMTAGMIRVQNSWVKLDGLFCRGYGLSNGGVGIRFSGTDPGAGGKHTHGAQAVRCGAVEFNTGFVYGAWADHATLRDCSANGNNDGVSFELNNHYDHYAEGCLFDGNVRSSVFLPDGVPTDNFVMIRCHLGFSQYGIYNPDTTNSFNGFSGLTMIGCPIEAVSLGQMVLGTTGLIHVVGGYWGWSATPANPCVRIRNNNHGPCYFNPRLDPNLDNASATAFIQVLDSGPYPITVDTPTGDFIGDKPSIIGSYQGRGAVSYAATFTPEPEYWNSQVMTMTGNVAVNVPVGRTDLAMKMVFIASGGTRTVTFNGSYRTSTGATRGAHSIASGQALVSEFEYVDGLGAWVLTQTQITAT